MGAKLDDREQRIVTIAMLLTVFKQIGGSARTAAAALGVSAATLSYWQAVKSARGRSIATPSDEQLSRMVDLVRLQLYKGLSALTALATDERLLRFRERYLLLKETSLLEGLAPQWREQLERHENAVLEICALSDKLGAAIGSLLKPEFNPAQLSELTAARGLIDAQDPAKSIVELHRALTAGSGEGQTVKDAQGLKELEAVYLRVMKLLASKETEESGRAKK